MIYFQKFICIALGLGSGAIISGAVFAFIAIIGVVPRLAQKTKTSNCIVLYEEAITLGGIIGAIFLLFDIRLSIGNTFLGQIMFAFLGVCGGVFFGVLAICLAETLDVIPILTKRLRLKTGIKYILISFAIGKIIGAILYFAVDGFYTF